MTPRRTQLVGGLAAAGLGFTIGAMVHLHPEGLHSPAWVAYMAASAFVLAGLCLLAGALGAAWLQRWLGVAVTLCLLGISLWIAFGPGERACSMSIPLLQTIAADAVCRGAFGVGSLLVALFLCLLLRRATKPEPGP